MARVPESVAPCRWHLPAGIAEPVTGAAVIIPRSASGPEFQTEAASSLALIAGPQGILVRALRPGRLRGGSRTANGARSATGGCRGSRGRLPPQQQENEKSKGHGRIPSPHSAARWGNGEAEPQSCIVAAAAAYCQPPACCDRYCLSAYYTAALVGPVGFPVDDLALRNNRRAHLLR